MEMRGQLQARPLALGGGGDRNQPKRLQGGLSTGMDVCREDKFLAPRRESNHNYSVAQPVPSHYSDYIMSTPAGGQVGT